MNATNFTRTRKKVSPEAKEFLVVCEVTISMTKSIFAVSEEEALALATKLGIPGLCHSCSRDDHDDVWALSEIDGEPQNIRVE